MIHVRNAGVREKFRAKGAEEQGVQRTIHRESRPAGPRALVAMERGSVAARPAAGLDGNRVRELPRATRQFWPNNGIERRRR
jgi:hypothetical protein